MIMYRQQELSFTAGELSPWARSRVDLEMFQRSAERIKNFFITPFGGLMRRPGWQYISPAATQSEETKLFSFQYSVNEGYVLEFYPKGIRFYYQGALVQNAQGTPYVLSTPWSLPQSVRLLQINDVIYACCPDIPPQRIERYGHADWRLSKLSWKVLPWRTHSLQDKILSYEKVAGIYEGYEQYKLVVPDKNWLGPYGGDDYVRVTISQIDTPLWINGATLLNGYNLSSYDANLASANHNVGRCIKYQDNQGYVAYFRVIRSYQAASHYKNELDPHKYPEFFEYGVENLEPPLRVIGEWEFKTTGVWAGELLLQKSLDNGASWNTVRSFFSNNDANYLVNGDESELPCLMRICLGQSINGKTMTTIGLRSIGGRVHGVFRLIDTAYGLNGALAINVSRDIFPQSGTTRDWSEGAFGSVHGYPQAMAWHQNRLIFAATRSQPQTIWASKVDDYHQFQLGSKDTDALELTIAASSQNVIQWMHSQQRLFIATSEGEWTLETTNGSALTPSNPRFVCHSHQGAAAVVPIPAESSLLFVQRGGNRLREMSYKIEYDGYTTTDLTLFSDHIVAGGLREIHIFHSNLQMICGVLKNGKLALMTWIPQQNVLAWSTWEHSLDGKILSVTTLFSENKAYQEIWAVVEYTIGGVSQRSIQRLGSLPEWNSIHENSSFVEKSPYLDHYVIRPCRSSHTYIQLNNFPHLKGLRVSAHPEGSPHLGVKDIPVVGSGNISFTVPKPIPAGNWVIGIPFKSELKTLPLEQLDTLGKKKNYIATDVTIMNSYPSVEYAYGNSAPCFLTQKTDLLHGAEVKTSPYGYVSGTLRLQQDSSYQVSPQLLLRTEEAHPLNILAIISQLALMQEN